MVVGNRESREPSCASRARKAILFCIQPVWDNLFGATNYLNKILLEIERGLRFCDATTTTRPMPICDIMRATGILMHSSQRLQINLCACFWTQQYFNDGKHDDEDLYRSFAHQLDIFTYRVRWNKKSPLSEKTSWSPMNERERKC